MVIWSASVARIPTHYTTGIDEVAAPLLGGALFKFRGNSGVIGVMADNVK